MRLSTLVVALLGVATAPLAHADIFVGRFGTVGDNNIVSVFADGADGDPNPIRRIGGNTSTLGSCNGIAYIPGTGELLIADFSGQAVRVFTRLANGNIAPIRSITSTSMGQPRDIIADPVHNELFVITQLSFVTTYPLNASGATAPLRSFGFTSSQMDNPGFIAYSLQRDELYVTDYAQLGPGFEDEILVFPRTATSGAAPIRFLRGSNTGFSVNGNITVAVNDAAGELYVATSGLGTGSIATFPLAAGGNVMPIRRIAGPATTLNTDAGFFGALAYNPANDTLSLTTELNGANPSIVTFARTADGNVAPLRRVAGPNSGSLNSFGWYSIEAVDFDPVFANGFE
jgi:hypothetical protein